MSRVNFGVVDLYSRVIGSFVDEVSCVVRKIESVSEAVVKSRS